MQNTEETGNPLERDDPRMDLYQVIRKWREENQETVPITRLFYAASLVEADKNMKFDIHELMAAMVKKLSQEEGSKLTGYLQHKGSYILHFLEGENHVIEKFLRYLVNESKKEKSIYLAINILAINEENPKRFYEAWLYEGPFPFAPVLEMDKSEQQMRERLWAIYSLFCNAGNKTKGARDVRNLKLVNEVSLSNEDVFMLMHKYFMNINDYASIYLKDLEIDLDNEHVFPYPISLTSVLEFSDIGELTKLID